MISLFATFFVDLARAGAPLPAFPGAEGFGGLATGGRGGRILHVTTLAESGPGSLREALEAEGPRVVVFDVSGVIDLGEPSCDDIFDEGDANNVLVIRHSDLTIAGQSAQGAGVTLRGRLYAEYDERVGNIVVRHLRIRPAPFDCPGGDGEQYDALRFSVNDRAIFDHVSVSWGVDENIDAWQGSHLTLQWSIVAEGATEGHPEGEHNYGFLNDKGPVSVLHNLFAHNLNRNPAIAVGPGESINNVAYNVRHGLVNHNESRGSFNVVGNVFKRGPDDELHPFFLDGGAGASWYLSDNAVDDPGLFSGTIDDPWSDGYFEMGIGPQVRAEAPFDFSTEDSWAPVTVQPSGEAYGAVLAAAGAFPRDVIDQRITSEVEDRSGSWGAHPARDLLEGLSPSAALPDEDGDGMADAFEAATGLDPNDAGDAWTPMSDGWPALEVYLQCRAEALLDPSRDCTSSEAVPGEEIPDRGAGGRHEKRGCDAGAGDGPWLGLILVGLLARRSAGALLLSACVTIGPEGGRGGKDRGEHSGDSGDAPSSDTGERPERADAVVTWTYGDRVFLRGTGERDEVVDVSEAVRAPGGYERWLVPSPGGSFFALSSDRGDGEGEVLVRVAGDLSAVEKVKPDGAAVYLEGMAAVSDDGDTVVFPASGGPNAIDLFATERRGDGSWSSAVVLTASSPYPYNNQPSWSRDGERLLFNCGANRDPESGDNDACSVSLEGGTVDVIVAHDALPDGRNTYVNFPRDAGGGRVVFEGSWPQDGGEPPETLWQRDGDADPVPAVSRDLDNTVSPCVLSDGSIVALWLGRPGGSGAHELTHALPDGSWQTLLLDVDVADIGIGCTIR